MFCLYTIADERKKFCSYQSYVTDPTDTDQFDSFELSSNSPSIISRQSHASTKKLIRQTSLHHHRQNQNKPSHQKQIHTAMQPHHHPHHDDRTKSSNQMQLDLFTDQTNDTDSPHQHQRQKRMSTSGAGQDKDRSTPAPEISSEASAPNTSFCCDSMATDSQTSNHSNNEHRRRHAINITSNPGYQVSIEHIRQIRTVLGFVQQLSGHLTERIRKYRNPVTVQSVNK